MSAHTAMRMESVGVDVERERGNECAIESHRIHSNEQCIYIWKCVHT